MTTTKPAPKEYRPFSVTAVVTREVSFLVDARTSEEAQSIVEEWIEDGETGTVNATEVEIEDCYPADGIETDSERPLNRSLFTRTDDLPEYLD
jgi:hypothetical protein